MKKVLSYYHSFLYYVNYQKNKYDRYIFKKASIMLLSQRIGIYHANTVSILV